MRDGYKTSELGPTMPAREQNPVFEATHHSPKKKAAAIDSPLSTKTLVELPFEHGNNLSGLVETARNALVRRCDDLSVLDDSPRWSSESSRCRFQRERSSTFARASRCELEMRVHGLWVHSLRVQRIVGIEPNPKESLACVRRQEREHTRGDCLYELEQSPAIPSAPIIRQPLNLATRACR